MKLELPNIIDIDTSEMNATTFLAKIDDELKLMGYKRYAGQYRNEDVRYWKAFKSKEDEKIMYQIGVLIYDFTKFKTANRIGVSFCCLIHRNNYELTACDKDTNLAEFEQMSKDFFNFFEKQKKKK